VCCEQEETALLPYADMLVLGYHCLSICYPFCIYKEIRAFWSVVSHMITYSISLLFLNETHKKADADPPYSFICYDLRMHS